MELGSLTDIILMVFGFLLTAWTTAKVIFAKVVRAVDEIEDAVTTGADVLKQSSDVLNAIVEAGKPDADGSIKISPTEWAKIKTEVKEVKKATDSFMFELKEAWSALRAVFKK